MKKLDNLKILDVNEMPVHLYDQQYSMNNEHEGRQELILPIGRYYKNTDKATLNYLKNHDPCLPHSINTLHFQNPYKSSQRLEGYVSRDQNFTVRAASFKSMFRSRESTLRSRGNKNLEIKREGAPTQHSDLNEDTDESSCKSQLRTCYKNSELGTTVQQYCTNSTLHGLRYVGDRDLTIVESTELTQKSESSEGEFVNKISNFTDIHIVFWVISFTVAVLTATYYIWFLYEKWVSAPIIISLSPESVSLNEFPFPSVTICNMNNVKRSEAVRINAGDDVLEKLLLEDRCDFENSSVDFELEQNVITWKNMLRFMINVSQPCTDMLYYCQWHGNDTDCEKIFNPTMTDEGICCNFNSVHRNHLFYNPRDWADLNITFPFSSIDWNPETGYDKNVAADSIPWRPSGAGLYYGLTLVLDANIEEYYCSSTASLGFKMLLHNPVETPRIADFAFAVTPGEETRVIVSPRISTSNPSIISVPQTKRKCFFTTERKLRYYRTYTQRNCVLECAANFTQKICHCVQYYMPKSSNTKICEKKDDLCATNARRAMEVKLYGDDIGITTLNVSETPSCNCWPGCFEINYNVEISQSKLSPTFVIAEQYIKNNKKYFTENMAVVHLYFVESQFTKFVKNELFGFTEFLSSTGGLLGLFMGFSFLSFMEIVYFATLRLGCRLYKNSSRNRTVHQVHPLDHSQNVVYPFAQ